MKLALVLASLLLFTSYCLATDPVENPAQYKNKVIAAQESNSLIPLELGEPQKATISSSKASSIFTFEAEKNKTYEVTLTPENDIKENVNVTILNPLYNPLSAQATKPSRSHQPAQKKRFSVKRDGTFYIELNPTRSLSKANTYRIRINEEDIESDDTDDRH